MFGRATIRLGIGPHSSFILPSHDEAAPARESAARSTDASQRTPLCELECGSMPNVMAALPNIGGALCSTPHSLADAHY